MIIYSWGLLPVQLLDCLQIEVLGGNANDENVWWHVSQEDFEKARTNKELRSALAAVKTGKKMISPNPVYVEAIEGGPWKGFVVYAERRSPSRCTIHPVVRYSEWGPLRVL